MRNVLLAFASLATLSSVASAEPLSVSDETSRDPVPTTYVQGGLVAGVTGDTGFAGASTEIGKRVASILSVHASFAMGTASEILGPSGGSMMQVRTGADLMSCAANGGGCMFVGADVGVQHVQVMSSDDAHTQAIGVGRVGLDIGGTNLRWRPTIEASITGNGESGVALTQSIAYRF